MIQLYLENQLVELSDKIDYAITKAFFDMNDPSKLCDDWSKTIKIPMTEKNKALFGQWQLPNRATVSGGSTVGMSFSPYTKVPYSLYDMGEKIMEGHLKMNKTTYSQKDKYYEATLYGNWNESLNTLKTATAKDILDTVYFNSIGFDLKKLTQNTSTAYIQSIDAGYRVFPNTLGNYYPDFNSDQCVSLTDKKVYSYDRELPILSTKEFRIDKLPLYKSVQSIFSEITTYTKNLILDPIFFSKGNPYYAKTWWQVAPPFANYSAESNAKIDSTEKMIYYSGSAIPTKESATAMGSAASVGIPIYNGDSVAMLIKAQNYGASYNQSEFDYRIQDMYMLLTNQLVLSISNIYSDGIIKISTIGTGDYHTNDAYNYFSLTSGTFIEAVISLTQDFGNGNLSQPDRVKTYALCMEGDESNCAFPEGDIVVTLKPCKMEYNFYESSQMGDNIFYEEYHGKTNTLKFVSNPIEDKDNIFALHNATEAPAKTRMKVTFQIRKGANGDSGTFISSSDLYNTPYIPNYHHVSRFPVNTSIPMGGLSLKMYNDFYRNEAAKVSNLFSGLDYFEFLCNYAKMFNLKLITKDGYNVLTTNDRLLGYNPNLDEYKIDYNNSDSGVEIDRSTINYEPVWLESSHMELTYDENDLMYSNRFLNEYDKQYGSYVKSSYNEFAVDRSPIYSSPLFPTITTDVEALWYPKYTLKNPNDEGDGLILDPGSSVKEIRRIINRNTGDGELIQDGKSMVFESRDYTKYSHAFWSVSTPEMLNNNDYSYYRKISELNENVLKSTLKKDLYSYYNWSAEEPHMSISSKTAQETYDRYSILFEPTATKYYSGAPAVERGLKTNFHGYLDDLYSVDSRKLKCKAFVDLSKFQWYHLLTIDGCNWLVTKINNWKESKTLCDLELIKVEDIDKYKTTHWGFDQFNIYRQNVKGKAGTEFMLICSHDANDTGIYVNTYSDRITLIEQTQIFDDTCVYKYRINADATEPYTIEFESDSSEYAYVSVIP